MRKCTLPVDEARPAGRNSASWHAREAGAAPGLYFVRIEAMGLRATRPFVFIR
jgi:hypothetical protein